MNHPLAEETAELLWHFYAPLDCWGCFQLLLEGLAVAKAERYAALQSHDWAAADRALAEIVELTRLCAAMSQGMSDARKRWYLDGAPWPLCAADFDTASPTYGMSVDQ